MNTYLMVKNEGKDELKNDVGYPLVKWLLLKYYI
jgi:flagellar biosynthesis protein FlhB